MYINVRICEDGEHRNIKQHNNKNNYVYGREQKTKTVCTECASGASHKNGLDKLSYSHRIHSRWIIDILYTHVQQCALGHGVALSMPQLYTPTSNKW